MAEFRIGRLKFNWRALWLANTAYVIDDIVKFGANTYVCMENHTSSANETLFYTTDFIVFYYFYINIIFPCFQVDTSSI